MKYYCPKLWYRNVCGTMPTQGDVLIDVLLVIGGKRRTVTRERLTENFARVPAENWRWNINTHYGDIEYFRVRHKTPMLVENPSVQLHEMLNERTG